MPFWNEKPDRKQLSGHQRIKKKKSGLPNPDFSGMNTL